MHSAAHSRFFQGYAVAMAPTVLWFRRDLRLADHPALLAARDAGEEVVPLFVNDPALRGPSGPRRLAFLSGCLAALDADLGGRLCIRTGDPAEVVSAVAREVVAGSVHVSEDFGPYGRRRDEAVEAALGVDGRALVRTGSAYAVSPGRVTRGADQPYKVFTPYYHAWREHGWRQPAARPESIAWVALPGERVPEAPDLGRVQLPEPGERAAAAQLEAFLSESVREYADRRDLPGVAGTSRLSAYLKYGCVHPRTVLATVAGSKGEETFRQELAWRDFYADVLFRQPESARTDLTDALAGMPYDSGPEADARLEAWKQGRTGYPIVDAGMRQLDTEAWMHNRVRMIVASFFIKDLHLHWHEGARWFMHQLVDGDLASNNHGWQWVAGTGTDAAPFFRVFNPVLQGTKFDPDGEYVRRYVPELRDVPGGAVHEPWKLPGGLPAGYPERIVDHAAERKVALGRYATARGQA